ncbi:MAG: radical SAM protein [Patescibacteria group bacterium]
MRVLWLIQRSDFIDPMGICYLSAVGKNAGHQMDLAVIEDSNVFQKIVDYKPGVIAYSAVTGEHQGYFNLNKKIKEQFPDIFTIMGGSHPTFYPKCVDYQPIDAIAVGEGEGAFEELLNTVEAGEDIQGILNIGTKTGGVNRKRNLIGDLDTLPFPDRDLLFANTPIGGFPLKTFITSRGCPFPCTYCFEPVLKKMYREEKAMGSIQMLDAKTGRQSGKYERRHSPERVCEEILQVKSKWPVEFIKFEDDLFVLHVDRWLEEFVRVYPNKIGIPFNALVRVDSINAEMLRLLKEAGCVSLNVSVDHANFEVRKRVIKKKFTNDDVIRLFRLAESYGIGIFNNMILAVPDSTIEDDKDAVRLDIASGVKFASFSILMPYPGTEIGKYCEDKGYFKMDPDNMSESLLERSPLSCFSEEEKDQQKNILYLGGLALLIGNSATWFTRKVKKIDEFFSHNHLSLLCTLTGLLNKIFSAACNFMVEFILNFLTKALSPNRLYMAVYYMVKALTLKYYIYPIKFGNFFTGLKSFIKGFRIEVLRTMPEMKKNITYPGPRPTD